MLPVFALLGGCNIYRNVTVFVVDAETRSPIAGATVEVYYSSIRTAYEDSEQTDRRGRARVRVAVNNGAQLIPSAPGYLPAIDQERYRGPFDRPATLSLFKEPPPRIVLVVPDGFQGVVRAAEYETLMPQKFPAGQRVFDVPADLTGVTRFTDVPSIGGYHNRGHVDTARFANGDPLPLARRWDEADGLAMWDIGKEPGALTVFVVGSVADAVAEAERRIFASPEGMAKTFYPNKRGFLRRGESPRN
jgi:hypothetical protein